MTLRELRFRPAGAETELHWPSRGAQDLPRVSHGLRVKFQLPWEAAMTDRIPLQKVRDLILVGFPLPFRVLDSFERLLLNKGQLLVDEAQFESLAERGAWAEPAAVEEARAALAAANGKALAPRRSLFDRWERSLWELDKLTRALVRHQMGVSEIGKFYAELRELIDRDPDVALFLSVRNDERRFALYPLT
ncbi:MAG TPA: hypothetical protein VE029_10630, partial [Rhizobacter sp.]|nr:hypothetical protein [Rhizobacter sp.]